MKIGRRMFALVAMLALVLLTACGSGSSGGSGTTDSGGSGAASTATTAAESSPSATESTATGDAERGGTVVLMFSNDPPHLVPALNADQALQFIGAPIFSGLVSLDTELQPVPDLAEEWTISPDGLRYEFKLRENAVFHDGTPVTSADVRYTIEEVSLKYHARAMTAFRNVESIETPDDHTIIFNMANPFPAFMLELTAAEMGILPKHIYEGSDPRENPANMRPVGSGPFQFKEWVKGDHVALTRFDQYYKDDKPYADELIIRIIGDPSSRVAAFEKGEVDYFPYQVLPRAQVAQLEQLPGVERFNGAGFPAALVLNWNIQEGPLANVEVRRALAHAVNRQMITDRAYFGQGVPSTGPIPSTLTTFYSPDVPEYAYDVDKANEMLDAAGFPRGDGGQRFSLRLTYDRSQDALETTAQILRDNLKDVGVEVELRPVELAVALEQVFTHYDYDMFIASVTTNGDPAIGVSRFYTTESIRQGSNYVNSARYSRPEVDELFAKADSTVDIEERKRLYAEVQRLIVEDLPQLWLVDYFGVDLSQNLGGVFQSVYVHLQTDELWRKSQ